MGAPAKPADLDGVYAGLCQCLAHGQKFFDGEPARHFVRGIDFNPYGVIRADSPADGMVHFQHNAQAVFRRAAVFIRAPVEDGGDEMGE